MTLPGIVPGKWRKSSYTSNDNCVEFRAPADSGDAVDVRDTKDRAGGQLAVTPAAWSAFIGGLKNR